MGEEEIPEETHHFCSRADWQREPDQVVKLLSGYLVHLGAIQGNEVPFRHAAHPCILHGHAAAQN